MPPLVAHAYLANALAVIKFTFNWWGGVVNFIVMDPSKSIVTVSSKIRNFSFSVYKNLIVCGPLTLSRAKYFCRKSFRFDQSNFYKLFIAFHSIISFISNESQTNTANGSICNYSKLFQYDWKCTKTTECFIFLIVKHGSKNVFEQKLSLLEFNEFVGLIGKLILPALDLRNCYFPIFKATIALDIDLLLSFQDSKLISSFLEKEKHFCLLNEIDKYAVELLHIQYLDALIAANKIISLHNNGESMTNENIVLMEHC